MAAAGPGGGQPSSGAFADQIAFELGQGREHMEDELAARGGGVDRLLQGDLGIRLAHCERSAAKLSGT